MRFSDLEQKWSNNIRSWQEDWHNLACPQAIQDKALLLKWIQGTMSNRDVHSNVENMEDQSIFSKYTLRNSCSNTTTYTYIEPLAVSLRSPFYFCVPVSKDNSEIGGPQKYNLFDTQFLMFPSSSEVNLASSPGTFRRNFFFDLGSTWYDEGVAGYRDSFKWFKDTYNSRGIVFDRVYAWEAQQTINHLKYWGRIPEDMGTKFAFFNYPASEVIGSSRNPLTHVKLKCRPDDYVVFKLDIDNNQVEEAFIRQILDDPELHLLIDEIFWENHVSKHPLINAWGSKNVAQTTADSYELFSRLRRTGIRAHSWI